MVIMVRTRDALAGIRHQHCISCSISAAAELARDLQPKGGPPTLVLLGHDIRVIVTLFGFLGLPLVTVLDDGPGPRSAAGNMPGSAALSAPPHRGHLH